MAALRLTDSPEERAEATRLLAPATVLVEKRAPKAPDAIQNEAVIRLAGYWYDQPVAGKGSGYAHAFRNSGAGSVLASWVVHRAGIIGAVVVVDEDEGGEVATVQRFIQDSPFTVTFVWQNISAAYSAGDYQLQVSATVLYARAVAAPSGGQDFFVADAQDLIEFAGGIATTPTWVKLSGGPTTPGGETELLMPVRRYAD